MRSLDVFLYEAHAGTLVEEEEGRSSFRMSSQYRGLEERPVISQRFEDDLEAVYRGSKGRLPSFFANLVPDGVLREVIERTFEIPQGDDFGLLAAVGLDLPGAIKIRPGVSGEVPAFLSANEDLPPTDTELEAGFRFSLAGVQLKFSMCRAGGTLSLPGHARRGEWIIKLPHTRFPGLPANEFAVMNWARSSGLVVPECYLDSVDSLPEALRHYAVGDSQVLAVRRYDRSDKGPIHQEDLAQIVGLYPQMKYQFSYEKCAAVVFALGGETEFLEFTRRLAFVIASANADAHLKNWSVIYPDRILCRLSPLYDQVFTAAWPDQRPAELALSFMGKRRFGDIDDRLFARLAEKVGADSSMTLRAVDEVVRSAADCWGSSPMPALIPPEARSYLSEHWRSVPLLRSRGRLG